MTESPSRPDGPLFIVGCARTGSTLLRHMLNRSPNVCLASETHFFSGEGRHRRRRRLAAIRALPEARRERAVGELAADLIARGDWPWLRRNVQPDELADRLTASDLSDRSAFATMLELYRERACGGGTIGSAGPLLGEKTPAHLAAVPTLDDWFPGARFVHTFRDPRAIYASQLARVRQGRWGIKARLKWVPGRLIDPILAPVEAVRTTRAWSEAVRLDREYRRRLGDRYLLVRFEDLVTEPERELQRVCAFLEVPYDARMLTGVDVVGSSFAEARHSGEGVDPRSADRWRRSVSRPWQAWFRVALRRELGRFGYAPASR
jgi:hypothetical protein